MVKKASKHGKKIAIAKAKEYAPILAAKGLEKINQMDNGKIRKRRNQRGKGVGKAIEKTAIPIALSVLQNLFQIN